MFLNSPLEKIRRLFVAFNKYARDLVNSFQGLPIIPIFIRPMALRFIGIKIGAHSYINPNVRIVGNNIFIGEYCAINRGTLLDGSGKLNISERVHIGFDVIILSATHEIMPSIYRRDRAQNNLCNTVINRGVWIGSGAKINAGITIGQGCVIAAGAVVVKNCEDNGLYAGVPARRIKSLPVQHERPIFNGKPI